MHTCIRQHHRHSYCSARLVYPWPSCCSHPRLAQQAVPRLCCLVSYRCITCNDVHITCKQAFHRSCCNLSVVHNMPLFRRCARKAHEAYDFMMPPFLQPLYLRSTVAFRPPPSRNSTRTPFHLLLCQKCAGLSLMRSFPTKAAQQPRRALRTSAVSSPRSSERVFRESGTVRASVSGCDHISDLLSQELRTAVYY